jgi:hypothetical protein
MIELWVLHFIGVLSKPLIVVLQKLICYSGFDKHETRKESTANASETREIRGKKWLKLDLTARENDKGEEQERTKVGLCFSKQPFFHGYP